MIALLGPIDRVIIRWHKQVRRRASRDWLYLWQFHNARGFLWLLVLSAFAGLVLFVADLGALLIESSSRPPVGGLDLVCLAICGVILVWYLILLQDMAASSALDPLLRSVPALCRYNSSVIIYGLLT